MASDELDIARLLRKRIETRLTTQQWSEDSEVKFAPLYLADEIIRPDVSALCRSLFQSSVADERSEKFKAGESKWRMLAILLYIKCSKVFLQRLLENDLPLDDSKLPLGLTLAQSFLGKDIGREFYLKQYIFSPAILREGEELKYVGEERKFRLPFLAVKTIGHGGYGNVYKVKVARGHYFPKDTEKWGPNPIDRDFAWKEFHEKDKQFYETELRNNRAIRESPSFRDDLNVVLSHGSLRRDMKYSLYFDLASCDLEKYLAERVRVPRSVKEIKSFLGRFHGLLDALVFLHTALKSRSGEDICAVHGDIKPSNILVFNKGLKEEVWKLNDFGQSEVMREQRRVKSKFLGIAVGATQSSNQGDSSNSGMRLIRTGPFIAPETQTTRESNIGSVKAKSDVWSMGCVLAILLVFLIDGSSSIEEFHKRRMGSTNGLSDCFFVAKGKKLVLNEGAKDTLGSLARDIKGALTDAEAEFLSNATSLTGTCPIEPEKVERVSQEMVSLLKNKVLIVEPSGRADSPKFAERFKQNMTLFETSNGQFNNRKASMSLGNILGTKGSIKNETDPPRTWSLDIPPESSSTKFSNCGNYLAFLSEEKIALYTTVRTGGVLSTDAKEPAKLSRMAKTSKCPEGSVWAGFDISSTHLIAFTAGRHFDLYIHSCSDMNHSRIMDRRQVERVNLPPIFRVLLSPDGETIILVFSKPPLHFLYASRIKDISTWSDMNREPVDKQVSLSTTAHGSRQSTSTSAPTTPSNQKAPILPWKSVLLNPPEYDGELDVAEIHDMRFSADSSLFTVLSHLPKISGDKETKKMFYSWPRMEDGQFSAGTVKRTLRTIKGDIDVNEKWDTAFVPITEPQSSILSITFTRTISQFGLEDTVTATDWASQELDIQILDVLPVPQGDHWIFIGREKRNKGTVKALYGSMRSFRNRMPKIHFDFVLDLECTDWKIGRDSATTLNKGMQVLIARLDGTGFVRQIYRPIAGRND